MSLYIYSISGRVPLQLVILISPGEGNLGVVGRNFSLYPCKDTVQKCEHMTLLPIQNKLNLHIYINKSVLQATQPARGIAGIKPCSQLSAPGLQAPGPSSQYHRHLLSGCHPACPFGHREVVRSPGAPRRPHSTAALFVHPKAACSPAAPGVTAGPRKSPPSRAAPRSVCKHRPQ